MFVKPPVCSFFMLPTFCIGDVATKRYVLAVFTFSQFLVSKPVLSKAVILPQSTGLQLGKRTPIWIELVPVKLVISTVIKKAAI